MLNFFLAGPELVQWDVEVMSQTPYRLRLTVRHAKGAIVEYFTSTQAALARERELEELLIAARGVGRPAEMAVAL